MDDDACLIDHFVLDDLVEPSTGRLIARSTMTEGLMYRPLIEAMGLSWGGNFMTDFPVFVWREMLPDFRHWIANFNSSVSVAHDAVTEHTLIQGYHRMCKIQTGRMSEFTVIMNWAFSSEKWRPRYS